MLTTNRWIASKIERAIFATLERLRDGFLELQWQGRTRQFGDPSSMLRANLTVHNPRFFRRTLFGCDIGIGQAYMDGDWSTSDLPSLIRLAIRNLAILEQRNAWFSSLSRGMNVLRHRLRANTIRTSQDNIHAHYDLCNDFFRLFLDRHMVYSCGWFERETDSLEVAQTQKLDRICRKLQLHPGDHVLEIGTGWGAFALHAVQNYGCRVTTTTISRQQFRYAGDWFARCDPGQRIELIFDDYRKLRGQYDKIVSIEMFEAVGYKYYDDYFRACDGLLKASGSMLLQTITITDQKFPIYRKRSDWIQKYIFPGGELASVSGILRSLARSTRISLFHAEDMGAHYARTVAAWRERFHASISEIRKLGLDDRFIRMWDFYLGYCEGAFLERYISDFQLLMTKNYNRNQLFNEPWLQSCDCSFASHNIRTIENNADVLLNAKRGLEAAGTESPHRQIRLEEQN